MIKIGIIGIGNVSWNVHLPVLLSREDVKIIWICDINGKKKKIIEKKKILYFEDIDKIPINSTCDIILITTPYFERKRVFNKIKEKTKAIFFEKPYAMNTEDYHYLSENFEDYQITVGYMRRLMGNVKNIKSIIDENVFGELKNIDIQFGDIHYKFDSFRSDINQAGGGILVEAGSHWVDTVLYTTSALDIKNFYSKKKFHDGLDIDSFGKFDIIMENTNICNCNFNFSILRNTKNKITYKFDTCSIDLFLFEDDSNLIINSRSNNFILQEQEMLNSPHESLEVASIYWDKFLSGYKKKMKNEISINNFFLTTKFIELFYAE